MKFSIVKSSDLTDSSHSMRIDADFFRPDYLELQEKIVSIGSQKLVDFQVEIRHPKEIARNYVDDGVLFLRAQNVRPMSVDLTTNPVFVSEYDAERLKNNTIHYKDILLTRTGANFGQCAIYLESSTAISSSHTFIIKSGDLNPFFLTIFLNTKYGRMLLNKGMYGGSQPEIAPPFLQQIPVPNWKFIQHEIEQTYLKAQDLIQLSRTRYAEAEEILLSEIGLTDWQPQRQLKFIANFSDTQQAGRIDAAYFQPKYSEVVAAIKGYSGGWDKIENLVTIQKCIEVGSDEYLQQGIPFVRVSNLSPLEITEEKYISESLYEEVNQHQPQKGEILFTKDATPGIAYYLSEPPQRMIPSGGILRLKSKTDKVNNECLTLVLNSILTKQQANRDVGGSVIMHWRPEQIARVAIPIINPKTQNQIKQMVAESSKLRWQSKRILECVKRSVEVAIEQDEESAIVWLKEETVGSMTIAS